MKVALGAESSRQPRKNWGTSKSIFKYTPEYKNGIIQKETMKLTIDNFAKISHAEIELNGLTVIGGENNTGKSTVGKILYSIFRGTSDVARRVKAERFKAVREALTNATHEQITDDDCELVMNDVSSIRGILEQKFAMEIGKGRHDFSSEQLDRLIRDFADSFEPRVRENVQNALSMTRDRVEWVILQRVFNCVFHGQYHPLKADFPAAHLQLDVKNRMKSFRFHHDHAELNSNIDLFAHAILISNPDVMSYVNIKDIDRNPAYGRILDKYVYELVIKLVKDDSRASGILKEQRREFLEVALAQLDEMIGGVLGPDEQGDLALRENGNVIPTKVQNLSMGVKSLLLLRTLLTRGVLSEKDVLILDEPENHLHPEWQVYYAKALVLIQKAYDLTMVVTSHSQFFVNAIQRFVISEKLVDKTEFYLSRKDERRPGYCTMDAKGKFSSDIFRSFNRAYDKISLMSGEHDDEDLDTNIRS